MTISGPDLASAPTSESMAPCPRMTIEVSADHLSAWIFSTVSGNSAPITPGEVIRSLEEEKIALNEDVRERVNAFAALARKGDKQLKRFLVAEGRPVVECIDATFQRNEVLLQKEQDWQGNTPVNYYTYNSIHFVRKDDPIGSLVASVSGVNGIDVFGKSLKPQRNPKEVKLDKSMRRSESDPAIVLANDCGQIEFSDNVLSINEVFTVENDVDFETGSIDSPVDVQIRGTVHDGFVVKSERSITIAGAIESAVVQAKGDVLVRGGILQRGSATVESGGDIVARFCDEADLRASGDVKICKELMNSRVYTDGMLLAAQGAIIGGSAYAREGIEVSTLGSDANIGTDLVVGLHPDVTDKVEKIRNGLKSKRDAAENIRRAVQPLMADLKRLSPAQKEKATELIFKADTMDAEVAEAEAECETILSDARAEGIPHVLVSNIVYPGVTIRFGHRITSFRKSMRGPLKFVKRKIVNVNEIVAINQLTASMTVLPSCEVDEQLPEVVTQPIESGHGGGDG